MTWSNIYIPAVSSVAGAAASSAFSVASCIPAASCWFISQQHSPNPPAVATMQWKTKSALLFDSLQSTNRGWWSGWVTWVCCSCFLVRDRCRLWQLIRWRNSDWLKQRTPTIQQRRFSSRKKNVNSTSMIIHGSWKNKNYSVTSKRNVLPLWLLAPVMSMGSPTHFFSTTFSGDPCCSFAFAFSSLPSMAMSS